MALRKDKVAAALQAMKGICSDPENPTALPEVMGQLADILGNVFDDIAIPELPQIDSGDFGFPENEPFDFPTGGGGMPQFDPLGGFEGGSPGGGGGGEGGGGGGGGDGGGCNGQTFRQVETRHVTLLAKTEGDIPAAENGNPGKGTVKILEEVTRDAVQQNKCEQDCRRAHKQDKEDAEELLKNVRFAVQGRDFGRDFGHLGETRREAINTVRAKIASIESLWNDCLDGCEGDPNPEGPQESSCEAKVKNISCEKIEKDTTVVISGTATYQIEVDAQGNFCGEGCLYDEDLYVIVESCGCDE